MLGKFSCLSVIENLERRSKTFSLKIFTVCALFLPALGLYSVKLQVLDHTVIKKTVTERYSFSVIVIILFILGNNYTIKIAA